MKFTIRDVAKSANVSPATVSLVMNNRPGVSDETRKQVREVIDKLEYHPNLSARNLSLQKSSAIGLIITNISNPFFGELVSYVQQEIDKTNYSMILGISNDEVEKEKNAIKSMVSRNVEGIIIVPARDGEHDTSHLEYLESCNIPYIFLTTAYHGVDADCIMTDLEKATYEMTVELLNGGDNKIYFITDNRSLMLSSECIMGYMRAMKERGIIPKDEWIIETNPSIVNGEIITNEILENDKPDAIITVNEILALGVMKCLKERNILVPEEISVTSYDDLAYSSVLYKPLTTIKQPLKEISRKAVELMTERILGVDEPSQMYLIPGKLKVRESSKHII